MKFSNMEGNIFYKLTDITLFLLALAVLVLVGSLSCALISEAFPTDETIKKVELLEHKCDSLQREIDSIAE